MRVKGEGWEGEAVSRPSVVSGKSCWPWVAHRPAKSKISTKSQISNSKSQKARRIKQARFPRCVFNTKTLNLIYLMRLRRKLINLIQLHRRFICSARGRHEPGPGSRHGSGLMPPTSRGQMGTFRTPHTTHGQRLALYGRPAVALTSPRCFCSFRTSCLGDRRSPLLTACSLLHPTTLVPFPTNPFAFFAPLRLCARKTPQACLHPTCS